MIFIIMVVLYYKDVKRVGKDQIWLSFRARVLMYILFVIIPALMGFILGLKEQYCKKNIPIIEYSKKGGTMHGTLRKAQDKNI